MREIKFRVLLPTGGWGYYGTGFYGKVDYTHADQKTECQFTGLLDKNGKELFEGDIISGTLIKYSPLRTMGVIVWDGEFASFANKNEAGNTLLFEISSIEKIGTIYENPELLKEVQQ